MENEERQLKYCLIAYWLRQETMKLVDKFCVIDRTHLYLLTAIHKLGDVVNLNSIKAFDIARTTRKTHGAENAES